MTARNGAALLGCVPSPNSLELGVGEFAIDEHCAVAATSPDAECGRRLLRDLLGPVTGYAFADGGDDASIRLVHDATFGEDEGYRLHVDDRSVTIVAKDSAGFVNAVQTLRQLLSPSAFALGPLRRRWTVPALAVTDRPRCAWRGVLLDVARHFIPIESLFRFVDLVGGHKVNVVHLHLNDDQGWRFPSEAYPRLTEIGSWRSESRVGHELAPRGDEHGFDGTPHGGFYTREQLEALVAFAAARAVHVVPEIDLPGHAEAVLASYPELGHVGPIPVRTRWGVSRHILNVSDETMTFCRTIWDEVADIFPSKFVHVGGDECPRDEWRESPIAKERIRSSRLAGVDAIQTWFTGELARHLRSRGRRIVGWDDIFEAGEIPEDAIVMSWRGETGGIAAARSGHGVVMSPETPCYLDRYQSGDPLEPLAFGGCNPIEDLYGYEPAPSELVADDRQLILGMQANLWTEYVPDAASAEYMLFPRLCALAERAWGDGASDLSAFRGRLQIHLQRLDALGVNYRPLEGPRPHQQGGSGARKRFDPAAI